MPRWRTVALAALVCVASLGLGAGLGWRWMFRDALLVRAGKWPRLADVLRPRGNELTAALWGLPFLPIVWGGVLTLASALPFEPFSAYHAAGALVAPWFVVVVLCAFLRFLYAHACVPRGEAELVPDAPVAPVRAACKRNLQVALGCGLPGLVACSAAIVTGEGTVAMLAVFCLLPAVFAPVVGALAALPVLTRGLQLPARDPTPATPSPLARRAVVGAAALALLGLWVVGAAALLRPHSRGPLLRDDEFAAAAHCSARSSVPAPQTFTVDVDALRARLTDEGVECTAQQSVGDLSLPGQHLAWCASWDSVTPMRFVAFGPSWGRVVGQRQVQIEPEQFVTTRAGAVVLSRQPDGGVAVVRIGRNAAIDAEWRPPRPPHGWSHLVEDPAGGLVFAWGVDGGRTAVVALGEDLVPLVAPSIVRTPGMRSGWVTVGDLVCVQTRGGKRRTLVVDRSGRVWRPRLADRIAARPSLTFHLAWTGLVFALLGILVVRAGRARRAFARSAARGTLSEGRLVVRDDWSAILHRPDGELVRVNTEGATRLGYTNGELVSGPCVLVGVPDAARGAAYRSAPAEIDAARCFGIVRGGHATARAWTVAYAQRALETAIVVAWFVTGPALALALS